MEDKYTCTDHGEQDVVYLRVSVGNGEASMRVCYGCLESEPDKVTKILLKSLEPFRNLVS